LAVACGLARVDNRLIAAEYGVGRKHVRLASAERVIEIAGYQVGAMPPFGHRQPIQTLIDPAVIERETVYAGGGDDDAMMRIRSQELLKSIQSITLVKLHSLQSGTESSPSTT
jgi:prolyl-tRNA editing enzyme YbaK/EbsC (Cys-tRNA(Pro) deacylase)